MYKTDNPSRTTPLDAGRLNPYIITQVKTKRPK